MPPCMRPHHPGTKGRPRKTGTRLPNLSEALTDATTVWQRLTIPRWYGASERRIDIATGTAVWRHSGMPVVPIRWVLVRDPRGRFEPQALLCTALEPSPEQGLRWFVQRWQLEVTFEEPELIWASKRNGNGPIVPLPAPRPACSACSPA